MNFIKSKLEAKYKEGYTKGIDDASRIQGSMDAEQIERKALNMFCEKNHVVNPHHVFDLTKTGIYLGMEPATKEKAKEIKQQASLLKDFLLWDILQETIRNEAIHIGLKTSTNWDGVIHGKAMLTNLDIIRGIVDKMAKIDISKIPDASGTDPKIVL